MARKIVFWIFVILSAIVSWFVLSLHIYVQYGEMHVSSELGPYISCGPLSPIYGDDLTGYDGLVFSDCILAEDSFDIGQDVCIVRFCSWWGVYASLPYRSDNRGQDSIIGFPKHVELVRVWLPAIILPVD